jgi:segregation and condensation protein A
VNFQVASHQTENYRVTTEVFEGPLDLLLQLIERAELDITRLALAQVTDQYLEYMRTLQEQNAAEVSAFLVIAARLIQIKSEALLPRPVERPAGEEDPGEELARQLRLYRVFKRAAGWLMDRQAARLRTFLRVAAPPRVESHLDLSGITLADLMMAALGIYSNRMMEPFDHTLLVSRLSIREKIRFILEDLRDHGQTSFQNLINRNDSGKDTLHLETVVTFLALLELIKRRLIEARQIALFTDIAIFPLETWNPAEEIDFDLIE